MKENLPHIYRLSRQDLTPFQESQTKLKKLPNQTNTTSSQNELMSLTKSVLQQNRYIYLDLQEDGSKVKMLEKSEAANDGEQAEQFGDLCITNLSMLSKGSQHMYRYLERLKTDKNRKEQIDSMLFGRISPRRNAAHSSKQPSSMTSEEIDQFLKRREEQQQSEKLHQFEQELTRKIGVVQEMFPSALSQSTHFNSPITPRTKTNEDRQYSQLSELIIKMKQQATRRKRPYNLPALVNKSRSLDIKRPKRQIVNLL